VILDIRRRAFLTPSKSFAICDAIFDPGDLIFDPRRRAFWPPATWFSIIGNANIDWQRVFQFLTTRFSILETRLSNSGDALSDLWRRAFRSPASRFPTPAMPGDAVCF